ncbi:hypothetical protein JXB22_11000 [candidate division WOR-3 bacterium]|nr:hypothetical protein [candidate division WOR-3 bacterium]
MTLPREKETAEPVFRMTARPRSFITINVTAIIVGAVVVLGLLFIRMLFNPVLFVFIIIVLAAYMVVDYVVWVQRGIRCIEIYDDRIMIYRGKAAKSERIPASAITGIDVFSKLSRHVVNIMLGGRVDTSLPGVTLFRGPRVRITDDAFDAGEFKQFVIYLEKISEKIG